uniref:Uncharacterized protein n=1 Tax=Arundo donax TaxID=35708 RepID=A0A0A8YYQ6_ARUDO
MDDDVCKNLNNVNNIIKPNQLPWLSLNVNSMATAKSKTK